MEYQNGYVAIHPRYNKLVTAHRTAVENPFMILFIPEFLIAKLISSSKYLILGCSIITSLHDMIQFIMVEYDLSWPNFLTLIRNGASKRSKEHFL